MNLALLDSREFLSRAELAVVFDVSEATIRRWENKEGLPACPGGKKPVYATVAVKQWLLSRKKAA